MVSTMMSVLGELPWKRLPLYIVAQLTGGVLGSASQFFSLPDEIRTAQFAGVQVKFSIYQPEVFLHLLLTVYNS